MFLFHVEHNLLHKLEISAVQEADFYGRIYIGADMMGEWNGAIDVDMPEADYCVDYVKVWKKN